ncbi:type II toxin-antitoxin system RelE/ParE family toxin [Humisphaera borealis]|uniref:Type II toxin-antitoxin system RelE/ParE family toxin n=1 Tax=Humisphaera borealis TaxID=2807512 RepID=A0A7M2X3H9_9BACT|nr:type II toxin-antitoxin system RelE/ParE family toxin [Humisphaera borealis]QOV92234.1 type II toxin-antitoxin system RelE/ParE family toxin [Humisphaera borealis]
MKVTFEPDAEAELLHAVDYHNRIEPGLGDDLSGAVEEAIDLAVQFPEAWQIVEEGARRIRTKRFQYGVVYLFEGDSIHVIAVMHLRRKPGYWLDRLG